MAERFEVAVEAVGRTGTMLRVPIDVHAAFGRHRPPVVVTINAGYAFRSTVARYGEEYFLPLNRHNREAAGVHAGEVVTVALDLDTAPREVEVPAELAAALAGDGEAARAFDALSYSHRKEYADWIAEAKRAETRVRRAEKARGMLREGRTQR